MVPPPSTLGPRPLPLSWVWHSIADACCTNVSPLPGTLAHAASETSSSAIPLLLQRTRGGIPQERYGLLDAVGGNPSNMSPGDFPAVAIDSLLRADSQSRIRSLPDRTRPIPSSSTAIGIPLSRIKKSESQNQFYFCFRVALFKK